MKGLSPYVHHRSCIMPKKSGSSPAPMLRAEIADAKVIVFLRGIGAGILRYVDGVPIDALGVRTHEFFELVC